MFPLTHFTGPSPGKQHDATSASAVAAAAAASSSSPSSATPATEGGGGGGQSGNSNFGAPAVPALRADADVLLNCAGCGMYGMRGEFHDAVSCSAECAERVRSRRRER